MTTKDKHTLLKEHIYELGYEDALCFENPNYDDAFIGMSHDGRAVYDYDKMVECLMNEDNMSYEEAAEFIDYNTIRAIPYFGELAPIVVYPDNE